MRIAGKLLLGLLFGLLAFQPAEAWHVAGAELTYRCLGGAQYEITLKFYRDCNADTIHNAAQWPNDDPVYVHIFTSNNQELYQIVPIPVPLDKPHLIPEGVLACVSFPPQVCIQEAIFKQIVTLPARSGGYDIAWTRCCRNQNVVNLVNSNAVGVTFLAHIPGPELAVCNSMPVFRERPPLFLCQQRLLTFDHSAIDPDGDSLVYRLTHPYDGVNFAGIGVSPNAPRVTPNNPMGPPPYTKVPFVTGYDSLNAFGPGDVYTIDSVTGTLQINPPALGLYTVAISVFEYRNGILLSENKRDMEFIVIPCLDFGLPPVISHDLTGLNVSGDTIFVRADSAFCYTVTVSDPQPNDHLTATPLGEMTAAGATVSYHPGNPMKADICWTPACQYIGDVLRFIMQGRDSSDCPFYNYVFDTVWIKILPIPPNVPELTLDLNGLSFDADTIVVAYDSQLCFPFKVTGVTNPPSLSYEVFSDGIAPAPILNDVNGEHQISGQFCWRASCSGVNGAIPFVFRAKEYNKCNMPGYDYDTVWVKVVLPENPPPALTQYFPPGTVFSQDTVLLIIGETLCYDFLLTDQSPAGTLAIKGVTVEPIGVTNAATYKVDSADSLFIKGKICWKGGCNEINQTYRIILTCYDFGPCALDYVVKDTAYVRVVEPFNPPPTLTQDLTGLTFSGDSIFTYVDSTICYAFELKDATPASRLFQNATLTYLDGGVYNGAPPTLTFFLKNDTLWRGRVCWTAGCPQLGRPLRLTLTARDSSVCTLDYLREVSTLIFVSEPNNPLPYIRTTFPAQTVWEGQSAVVLADSVFCYKFSVVDTTKTGKISVRARVERLIPDGIQAPAPIITFFPPMAGDDTTARQGKICWEPGCAQVAGAFRIIIEALDSTKCTLSGIVRDTTFLTVKRKPLAPIRLSVAFGGLPYHGDTVMFNVKQPLCFDVTLIDSINFGKLTLSASGPPVEDFTPAASLSVTEDSLLLQSKLCWAANCHTLGGTFPLYLKGRSIPYCSTDTLFAYDTVYVKIIEAISRPPKIKWLGVPPYLVAGNDFCLEGRVQDPDAFAILHAFGQNETFKPDFGYGAGATLAETDSTINAKDFSVCFTPNCNQENGTYTLVVCGRDETLCTMSYTVCDTLTLPVKDCLLQFPNVFTPNGDGTNDYFEPFNLVGVAHYTLLVYDRWGQELFRGADKQSWDGKIGDQLAPEGVYYYVVRFQMQTGTGPAYKGEKTGSFTLLR